MTSLFTSRLGMKLDQTAEVSAELHRPCPKAYGEVGEDDNSMKLWVPVALGGLIAIAYAFFYELSLAETQGAASFSLANSVGIVAVFVGLIAAGVILRRATPPQ
ncbi:MAG: hypothetical protein OK452_01250 [Thaumarchaeota archaeon]|jgi:hypothetical protein|nr:hypothetical protein [Nitrososphaerota archaeon]